MGAGPAKAEQRLTVPEYLALERTAEHKSELYRGVLIPRTEMGSVQEGTLAMAGGSSPHARIASNLNGSLFQRIGNRPCQTYSSDMKVLAAATEFAAYPDVSMVCGEEQLADEKADCLLNPCLIAEVLSPSTQKYDREKFFYYQQLVSLQYYLLIHQDRALVELFSRPEGGKEWHYKIIGHPEDSAQGLAATLELPALDLELPLAEIYRRIRLEPSFPKK